MDNNFQSADLEKRAYRSQEAGAESATPKRQTKPQNSAVDMLLHLQRTAGNRAVSQLLRQYREGSGLTGIATLQRRVVQRDDADEQEQRVGSTRRGDYSINVPGIDIAQPVNTSASGGTVQRDPDDPDESTSSDPGLNQSSSSDPGPNQSSSSDSSPNQPTSTDPGQPTSGPQLRQPNQPTSTDPVLPTSSDPNQPTSSNPDQPTSTDPSQPTSPDPDQPKSSDPAQPTSTDPDQPTSTDPAPPSSDPDPDPAQPTSSDPDQPTSSDPGQPTSSDPDQPTTPDTDPDPDQPTTPDTDSDPDQPTNPDDDGIPDTDPDPDQPKSDDDDPDDDKAWEGTRALSGGERTQAQGVYQDSIEYDKVTITGGSVIGSTSRTLGNSIYLEDDEFEKGKSTLSGSGMNTLIHELGHVWQYQHGGGAYIPNALGAQLGAYIKTGDRSNAYKWRDAQAQNLPWADWNAEQQAEAMEDYYKAKQRVDKAQQRGEEPNPTDANTIATLEPHVGEVRGGRGAPLPYVAP